MINLRPSPVVFNEEEHSYWLGTKQLRGVTSTLVKRAFPDKYNDIDPEVLANAAQKGKILHQDIEYHDTFHTDASEHEDNRVALYEQLKQANGLTSIANEYLVSDCENYASSIDVVMTDADGRICLCDIKTSWTLDRESTALQLSIYRRFFEQQNPGLTVDRLYAIWLPNKDHTLGEMALLHPVADTVLDCLIAADLADNTFDITSTYGSLPVLVADAEDEIVRIEREMKIMKERQDKLKKGLYDIMEKYNVKSFRGARVLLTRVLPSKSETFDSKRFKEEHPELYADYVKTSNRAGSLKITVSDKQV